MEVKQRSNVEVTKTIQSPVRGGIDGAGGSGRLLGIDGGNDGGGPGGGGGAPQGGKGGGNDDGGPVSPP